MASTYNGVDLSHYNNGAVFENGHFRKATPAETDAYFARMKASPSNAGSTLGGIGGAIVGGVTGGPAGAVAGYGVGSKLGSKFDSAGSPEGGGGGAGGADGTAIEDQRRRAGALYDQLLAERNGVTPNVPVINDAQGQEIRKRQLGALDLFTGAANGTAPSAAAAQLQGASEDIAAQQMGIAGQARGNAGVFARRQAMSNIADSRRRSALDLSQLRAQEMANARAQLSGALSDVRTTDTNTAIQQSKNELTADQLAKNYKLGLGNQTLDANQQTAASAIEAAKLAEERRKREQDRSDNWYKSLAETANVVGKYWPKKDPEPVEV